MIRSTSDQSHGLGDAHRVVFQVIDDFDFVSRLLARTAPVGRVLHVVTIETKAKSVVEDVIGDELRLAGVFGRQLRRPGSQTARSAIEILVVQVPEQKS
jgi:hypothetical protein